MKDFKWICNENGFTLVEALLTIVIVGIVIVPISTIYMGSFTNTMENEDILVANQTSQLFLEYMKSRTYEELMDDCFDYDSDGDGYVELTNGHSLDMPPVPEGYEVQVYLAGGTFSSTSYEKPSMVSVSGNADVEIAFTGLDQYIIYDNINSSETTEDIDVDGPFTIEYAENGSYYEIIIKDTYNSNTYTVSNCPADGQSEINIISTAVVGDGTYTKDVPLEPTITISNTTTDSNGDLLINQYYHSDAVVEPNIASVNELVSNNTTVSGIVSYSDDSSSYFIYEIGVSVSKASATETLTSIRATINER